MSRVWITGAAGFLGRHLTMGLAVAGEEVHGIGHGVMPDLEMKRIGLSSWVNGEIEQANLAGIADRSGLPDVLYHLAGGSSVAPSIARPLEDFNRTVGTTARLLDWVRASAPNCHVIAVSSAAVYGAASAGSIPETAATSPISPYGHHKLMMEQLCRSYSESFGLHCTIVRLFSVYGSLLKKQLLWDLCSRLAHGENPLRLGGTGSEVRDWTEVRDVVRLLRAVIARGRPERLETVNGGSGRPSSTRDIATLVAQAWGGNIDVDFSGVSRPGDPVSLLSDSAIQRQIGFEWEIDLQSGIPEYVAWFKRQLSS